MACTCKRVVAVGARAYVGYVEERCFGNENANAISGATDTPTWLGRQKRIDVLNESIVTEIGSLSSESLNPKRAVLKRVQSTFAVGGDISVELSNDGFAYLIAQAIGRILISNSAYPVLILPIGSEGVTSDKTVVAVQMTSAQLVDSYVSGGEIVYDTLCSACDGYEVGYYNIDAYGMEPGMTFIIGRDPSVLKNETGVDPDNGNIYFEYTGMRVNTWAVTASPDAIVSSTFGMLGKSETIRDWTEQSGSEGVNDPFTGFNGTVTLYDSAYDSASETAITACVLSFDMTVNNNMATDQYCLGEKYRNSLPEQARTIEGSISVELVDLQLYYKFTQGTAAAIKVVFDLNDDGKETLSILLPHVEFTGTTPSNAGKEVINLELPFVAVWEDDAYHMLTGDIWDAEAAQGFDIAVEIMHEAATSGFARSFI